jgi:hypothetical protein
MTVLIRRSFLGGRSMGDAVVQEREETVSMLVAHGFKYAPLAMRRAQSWTDFERARGMMLAGGLHRVRLTGGRGIDR